MKAPDEDSIRQFCDLVRNADLSKDPEEHFDPLESAGQQFFELCVYVLEKKEPGSAVIKKVEYNEMHGFLTHRNRRSHETWTTLKIGTPYGMCRVSCKGRVSVAENTQVDATYGIMEDYPNTVYLRSIKHEKLKLKGINARLCPKNQSGEIEPLLYALLQDIS